MRINVARLVCLCMCLGVVCAIWNRYNLPLPANMYIVPMYKNMYARVYNTQWNRTTSCAKWTTRMQKNNIFEFPIHHFIYVERHTIRAHTHTRSLAYECTVLSLNAQQTHRICWCICIYIFRSADTLCVIYEYGWQNDCCDNPAICFLYLYSCILAKLLLFLSLFLSHCGRNVFFLLFYPLFTYACNHMSHIQPDTHGCQCHA